MLAMTGSILLLIATFLPWVKLQTLLGTVSVNGLDLDGSDAGWLLGLGIAAALTTSRIFFTDQPFGLADGIMTGLLGGFALYVAWWNMNEITNTGEQGASAGSGLWLVFVAGALLVFAGAFGIGESLSNRQPTTRGEQRPPGRVRQTFRYYQTGERPPTDQ